MHIVKFDEGHIEFSVKDVTVHVDALSDRLVFTIVNLTSQKETSVAVMENLYVRASAVFDLPVARKEFGIPWCKKSE